MPKAIANTIMDYLNQFAAKATRLSAVGAVALIITAVAMMCTIERAFNQIWRVKARRPLRAADRDLLGDHHARAACCSACRLPSRRLSVQAQPTAW